MADALISPAVGATLWVATGVTVAYSSRKISLEHDDRQVALMGVLGAFVFAAQMINFAIPGTGSSGHIGGGLLLAILLGSHAAFLVLASVLTVQALFFADGGLLALGCNVFNLAFFPCFIAYPLLYRKITGSDSGEKRIFFGSIIAAVFGLQLGSLGVVLETHTSGVAELPLQAFVLMMQPIHLAIGILEGCITAAVVLFMRKARPEILTWANAAQPAEGIALKKLAMFFLALALVTGSVFSWFASTRPDGLEWAIYKVTGTEEVTGHESEIHRELAVAQERLSLMPDYDFKDGSPSASKPDAWARPQVGTSLSGLTGGALTLTLTGCILMLLRRRKHSA